VRTDGRQDVDVVVGQRRVGGEKGRGEGNEGAQVVPKHGQTFFYKFL